MDKAFKDQTLEERTEHARAQMHFWRGVLRELNRELTAVTPQERDTLRTRVVDVVEAKTKPEIVPVVQ